ncbi:hypothetical protein K1T71_005566 [Dendrolimus kikuchii]|uniref:Uncharacterized protein n=1 Tax=Dendrolimus kikuchii TaxID=765133 RepID=A0ACC1D4Q4_9NEOP|nr:hypothetical protein K1T71_005566 [Dendrolimus kikuchii]
MASRVLLVLLVIGYVHSYSLQPLSCNEIRTFVDGHNYRRVQLAKGAVAGQPPATQMKFMVWDNELAAKAASWAVKDVEGHNPNRAVGRFKTGENIYWYSTTNKNVAFNPDEALDSWFAEHKNYVYSPVQENDVQRAQNNQILHYTQMVWSDSVYVGCAIARKYEGIWNKFKVVCNYGPAGNYIGQTPYKTNGRTTDKLLCTLNNCARPYGDRC